MIERRYEKMSKKALIDRLVEAEAQLRARDAESGSSRSPTLRRRSGGNSTPGKHPDPALAHRNATKAEATHSGGTDINFAAETDYQIRDRHGRIRRLYQVVKDIRNDTGEPVFSEGALYEVTSPASTPAGANDADHPRMSGNADQTELICRFRPNGTLTYVNEAYCRYFGVDRDELQDRNIISSISEADREQIHSRLKDLRPEHPVETIECRIVTAFGEVLWNQWTYRALFDGSGNILEYQSVGRDITFRKYTQEILEKRAAILEAVTSAAEAFLKSASWRDRIEEILERFGAALKASHVFLYENRIGQGGDIAVQRSYEWVSPVIKGARGRSRFLRNSGLAVRFSRWVYEKSEGQPIYGTIGQFPEEEVGDLALDKKLSIAIVPILLGARWWGFIGFADYSGDIQWTEEEIAPLGAASEILGVAVEREKKERALQESESRYRELADHLPVGIYEADPEGTIRYANTAAMEMFGYSQAEVERGVNFLAVVASEDRDKAISNNRLIRGGTPLVHQEYAMLRKDGSRFPALTRARPLLKNGRIVGSSGMITDISELKRVQEALRKNEALLGSILRAAPIGVGVVHDGMLGWVNDGLTEMTGYSVEEIRGKDTRVLYPDDEEFARARQRRDAEMASRGKAAVETRWKRKDGAMIEVHASYAPIDPANPVPGLVFTALDITAQKKASRILLYAKRDLEKQVAEQTRELDTANRLLRIELEEHRKTEEALVKSERLYRAIVEDQMELICRFHPDGTISFVNEAFCRYFGRSRDDLLGVRYMPPILREDRRSLWIAYDSLTPDCPVFQREVRIERPDGTIRWIQWSSRAIYDDAGILIEHQGVGRDITERKQSEQQIQESRNMLRSVFDGISDPLVMIREDMALIMLNRAALSFFGATMYHDVIGTPCLESLQGRYGEEASRAIQAAITGKEPARLELEAKEDVTRYEEVFVYPLRTDGGNPRLAILRITDRTKQRLMERELIQSEKLALLGLLIAGIVHEINNPNNFITFNTPILRDYLREILPVLDEHASKTPSFEVQGMPYAEFRMDVMKLLENIEHGSARINATVAKLKEFSRKKDEHGARPIRPSGVIERAVAICQTQIRKNVKTFDVQMQQNMPEMVSDPDAIEQALINLLINAAQAADKTDSHIRLKVWRGACSQEALVLEVEDNGCGMDRRTASRIFDPFFTTKEVGRGTGLGLYISKNLLESVGGRISVESEIGKGAAFRIVVPDLADPDRLEMRHEQYDEQKGVNA